MRLEWTPEGVFHNGVDRGVLYLGATAVPWNGLSKATQKEDDSTISVFYKDGVPFALTQGGDDFGVSVEVWTYPLEFEPYLGYADHLETAQPKKPFHFTWRDDKGDGHLIHLVWNAIVSPLDTPYSSKNDEQELTMFTWDIFTTPKTVAGIRPTAHLVVDTNLAPAAAVVALEDILYGSASLAPSMPDPQVVIDLFLAYAVLIITDNGDGTWTANGPSSVITMLDANTFQIKWPSALYITPAKYKVSTL